MFLFFVNRAVNKNSEDKRRFLIKALNNVILIVNFFSKKEAKQKLKNLNNSIKNKK